MSKKLLLIAAMSLFVAGGAFAAVDNIRVSGDVKATGLTRDLSLGSEEGSTLDAEDFLFSQVRVRIDADLTEGVQAVVRLINERIWGGDENDSYQDDRQIELDLAYVQLNGFLYDPLTLIVGRQNLYYGNGLIVGDPNTNRISAKTAQLGVAPFADLSLVKSFDAVRAILDYVPYTIDIIYAKVMENNTNEIDDQTLVGANVAYEWASYNGITEGYIFWTDGRTRGTLQVPENEDYTLTVGGRAQMDVNDNLTLGLEGAHQFGDYLSSASVSAATYDRDAWAAQFIAEYRFLNDYDTKVGFKYTYLSGDDDPTDGDWEAWDPVFEDQTPAEIINILMANSNAHYYTLTGSFMPREDITLGMLYTHAILDENVTTSAGTFSGPSGSPIANNTYAVDRDKTDIGDEIDLYAIYDYTEDVQIKLTGAVFIPGDFFADSNDSTAYSLRSSLNVEF
ncbi:MAG: hypothetical protein GF375_07125 [Candidatus Omnitrophica bacterium]|nr:hypothetical protein [Candidatus Omnitrophota bacterium]MBD3269749.1 hypothetical protein [Candidatus Omnitrophota bacterium]